jgi:hypothetical protein
MLLLGGCHSHHLTTAPLPANGAVATTTLDRIWILGASGPGVADTTLTFAQATGRTVVLRQPDSLQAIFATLRFPALADSLQQGDSTRIALHQEPGEYALTLTASSPLPPGSWIEFSYPIHFLTPPGAVAKYPDPGQLEQQLVPALIGSYGRVDILAAVHPAADLLRCAMPRPATFAVVFSK